MKFYHVGGSVRDVLLNRPVKDVDYLVTGATEQKMLALGYEQVGAAFPVFLHPLTRDEYALARRERKVGAGYLGFECEFGTDVTVEEDLSRRDLTINAIAYDDVHGTYIDPFNGMDDLKNKILRHTSEAFAEDPLRVIRLARFYARYSDFTIAPETVKIVQQIVASGEMDALSMERYWEELRKVFKDSPGQLSRFLDAIVMFGANQTAFFKDILGENLLTDCAIYNSAYGDRLNDIPNTELAMSAFVALYGCNAPLQHSAVPLCVKTLVKNFTFFKTNKPSKYDLKTMSEFLYSVLEQTRSLNGMSHMLLDLMDCLELDCVDTADLEKAVTVSATVSVKPFMHLVGKEIGVAMKAARIDEIYRMLNEI